METQLIQWNIPLIISQLWGNTTFSDIFNLQLTSFLQVEKQTDFGEGEN